MTEKVRSICVFIPQLLESGDAQGFCRQLHQEVPNARVMTLSGNTSAAPVSGDLADWIEIYPEYPRGLAQALLSVLPRIDEELLILVLDCKGLQTSAISLLIESHRQMRADMIIGSRRTTEGALVALRTVPSQAYRWVIRLAFGFSPLDVFSPVILLSRFCYKNIPILSRGFDLQIELIVQALDKNFRMMEVPVPVMGLENAEIPHRSWSDRGWALYLSFVLLRDYRPLYLFGAVAGGAVALSMLSGSVPIYEYFKYGIVRHLSMPVLAAALMIIAFILLQVGLLLESSLRYRREAYHRDLRKLFADTPGN